MRGPVHGGDIYTLAEEYAGPILDFSANVNPLGLPEGAREAAERSLADCAHYPDPLCRELRAALGERFSLPEEEILCGGGAAELLFRLALALRPRRALIPQPAFAEYAAALEAAGCRWEPFFLREEEGFALDEEALASQIDSFKAEASAMGQSYSAYIKQVYGNLVTKSVYESNLRDTAMANQFAQSYEDSLEYSDSDIQAEYEANANDYDLVDYAYITIDASPETETDEDGNTVEATEEETAAAWEAGQALAQELMEAWENGEDAEALAEDEEKATYYNTEGGSYNTASYVEWCFEEGRQAGEIHMIESEDTGRIYIVQFNRRYRDETRSVNVRHILVTEANLDEGVEATQENLEAKAQEILDTWDGTEDGFAQLANAYSQDAGSNTTGGLYEDVLPGQMVTNFNDWCFDESRQHGDTGIVYNEGSYTGAHIMYYVGQGDLIAWQETVRDALRSADYTAWETELVGTIESAELQDGAKYVA